METEERNQRGCKPLESEFFLRWGNRKRLRCVRVKGPEISQRVFGGLRRRAIGRCLVTPSGKESYLLQPNRFTRTSDGSMPRSDAGAGENRKSSSPEKEERYYTTRGSVGMDEYGKVSVDGNHQNGEERRFIWPKLYISLSSKEKEEDFMAMKGCKLPQRPKKRAKIIQRSLLLVSPGAWLTDMSQERYEVREKKSSKKRPRGLKAMGSIESDSERETNENVVN